MVTLCILCHYANLSTDINKLLYYFLCSLFIVVLVIKMVLVAVSTKTNYICFKVTVNSSQWKMCHLKNQGYNFVNKNKQGSLVLLNN